jgi:predicted O-linked N-acetylglucosamine transferase (SPINDLY family)
VRAIGLPELVTDTLADYEALALELAHDPGLLASYRTRLRTNRDREPLFDTAAYTRALEGLLWTAWDDWIAAKQPLNNDA